MVFSFGSTAKESYERMINIVNEANDFLDRKVNLKIDRNIDLEKINNNHVN